MGEWIRLKTTLATNEAGQTLENAVPLAEEPATPTTSWCLQLTPSVGVRRDCDNLQTGMTNGILSLEQQQQQIQTQIHPNSCNCGNCSPVPCGPKTTNLKPFAHGRACRRTASVLQQESNMEVGEDIAEAVSSNASQGDDGGGSASASDPGIVGPSFFRPSAGSDQGDAWPASLDAEWQNLWLELKEKMTLAGEGDVGMGSKASRDAMPWRGSMASWMAQRLAEGGSLSPDVMQRCG